MTRSLDDLMAEQDGLSPDLEVSCFFSAKGMLIEMRYDTKRQVRQRVNPEIASRLPVERSIASACEVSIEASASKVGLNERQDFLVVIAQADAEGYGRDGHPGFPMPCGKKTSFAIHETRKPIPESLAIDVRREWPRWNILTMPMLNAAFAKSVTKRSRRAIVDPRDLHHGVSRKVIGYKFFIKRERHQSRIFVSRPSRMPQRYAAGCKRFQENRPSAPKVAHGIIAVHTGLIRRRDFPLPLRRFGDRVSFSHDVALLSRVRCG